MSDTEKKVTPEDYELFNKIAKDIKANSVKYIEAGKWLDKYCNEEAYWQRQEDEVHKIGRDSSSNTYWEAWKEHRRLEQKTKERRTPALMIRFQETRNYLLEKYEDQQFIPEEDAKRIILTTWLLTDLDAEKADLGVTELERWPWEPIDDVTKMSRGYANYLWFHGGKVYSPWMNLVRIAWSKLNEDMDETIPSTTEDEKKKLARNFLKNLLRASIKHFPFCGPFLYDVIYGTLDSQAAQKETIRQPKITSGSVFEKQESVSKNKPVVEKWYQSRTIQAALIGAAVLLLVSIIGWLITIYINKSKTDSRKIETIPSENKLSLSLKEICQDIDSRPLLQQEVTAKQYIGIQVENEHLILVLANETSSEKTISLMMIRPEQVQSGNVTGRYIRFNVDKEKYPELVAAKQRAEFRISGRISNISNVLIDLSDVSLSFD